MRGDSRRKIAFKNGEKLFANSRAKPARITVRSFFTPDLVFRAEIVAQILAGDSEQRADNGASGRINARQASGSCSANQMSQNGFGLILGRVCYGDACRLSGGADALEECIAQAARGVFEIPSMTGGFGGNVLAGSHNLEPAITGQMLDELRIRCGSVTAQHVVKMND